MTANIRLNIIIKEINTDYCGMIEAEEDNYDYVNLMTGNFLGKTRGIILHITGNEIFKTKHINEEFKTIK